MSKTYFLRDGQYVRFDHGSEAVDSVQPPYPKGLTAGWTGLPVELHGGIHAAVNYGDGTAYFFLDDAYVAVDIEARTCSERRDTATNWPGLADLGLADDLDAAVTWPDHTVLFFRGSSVGVFDIAGNHTVGDTVDIAERWPALDAVDFADTFDAVVNYGDGIAYVFRGPQYVRLNMATGAVENGPRDIGAGWPGLVPSGFTADLTGSWSKASPFGGGGGGGGGATADTSDLSAGFFAAVRTVATKLGCPAIDLLAVMFSESGIKATATNPSSGNSGILQFGLDTLHGLGWPATQGLPEFRALSAEEQMVYVERFFMRHVAKGMTDAGRLHWAAWLPATVTAEITDPQHVIAAIGGPREADYGPQKILDVDNDGKITLENVDTWTWTQCTGPRWDAIKQRLGN